MAQEVRYGFMGKVNVAIIEACEVTPDGKIYLTAAGGIAPTVCRLADQIIVELNAAHSKSAMGLHDVYEPLRPSLPPRNPHLQAERPVSACPTSR